MKPIKISLSILAFLMSYSVSIAQISDGGMPVSFENFSCKSQNSVHCIHLPLVNNDAHRIADSLAQLNDSINLFNFGITLQASYNINNSGTWDTLLDGSRIWRLHLVSQGAYASYLLFDQFYIPQNAKLFAYNEDRTHVIGAFTNKNNKPYQKFSMGPIKGGSIVLEYFEPMETDTLPIVSISSFIHSFRDVYEIHDNFNNSGTCHINVRCPQGNGWCNQRRSVALIAMLTSTPGHYNAHCSGSLLTNEKRDGRPYFLTADHCIDGYDPSNFIFIFNYQSQDCNNPATAPQTTFSISGATTRANHSNSDFGLLELSSRPPGDFNVYYSGWSNDKDDMSGDGVIIHHPAGDIKKITLWDKVTSLKADYWKIKFTDGSTEGGSSGSPMYNSSGLVVGQNSHSNGEPVCDDDKRNWFGRFDKSWDAKNGSSNQLKPWLSPNSTSSVWISSMSGDEPCKENIYFENANDLHTSSNVNGILPFSGALPGTRSYNGVYTASGTIETGQNVTIQSGTSVEFYGETIILGPGFHAEAGSHFIGSPQPCLRGCNTGFGKMASPDLVNNDEEFVVLNTDVKKDEKVQEEENPKPVIVSDNIQIYPNPNAGKFEIAFSGDNLVSSRIIIYDAAGKLVYEQNNITQSKINIDISRYQKGIYTVQIIQNTNAYTKKIILQ